MRRAFLVTGAVVTTLAIGAYWALREHDGSVAPLRTVAFDNVYGTVEGLPVHVAVDGGPEQRLTAACDARTCTFKIPLTNGPHKLAVSVEQEGRRSAPTLVTVDTSNLR